MDKNNNLLHSLAAAAMALILVYAGEQWKVKQNEYLLATLWVSAFGVCLFVLSMVVGFVNEWCEKKAAVHGNAAQQYYLFNGTEVQKLELDILTANNMNAHSERKGWYLCYSLTTHIIERALTFTGATALAISPLLFVLGVIK